MEDKIREIVEAMGFSFSIGDIYHLNQWLQQPEKLPAVLYVMPINGGGEITVSGMLKKNIEPLLFFLDQIHYFPSVSRLIYFFIQQAKNQFFTLCSRNRIDDEYYSFHSFVHANLCQL